MVKKTNNIYINKFCSNFILKIDCFTSSINKIHEYPTLHIPSTTVDHFECHSRSPFDPFAALLLLQPTSQLHPATTHTRRWLMEPAPPQAAEQGNNHGQESAANRNQGPMGKHRMVAAISFLNQQIQIIQVIFHYQLFC